MPAPQWIPVRYVAHDQQCQFCGERIPKGSPGSRVGERGTRAWWDKAHDVWECIPCREEATRAELARDRKEVG